MKGTPRINLPNEILSAVFFEARAMNGPVYVPPRNTDHMEFPWKLRDVCRLWRTILDSDPRFWEILCVMHDSSQFGVSAWQEDHALSMGGAGPLVLHVCTSKFPMSSNYSVAGVPGVLPLIISQSHRLVEIHLKCPLSLEHCIRQLKHHSFPVLRACLMIDDGPSDMDVEIDPLMRLANVAPILNHLHLPIRMQATLIKEQLSLQNMKVISLPNTFLTDIEIMDILQLTCVLERFSIGSTSDHTRLAEPPKKPLALPHLQQLNVGMAQWVEPSWLAHIVTPSLTQFSVNALDPSSLRPSTYLGTPPRVSDLVALFLTIQVTPRSAWKLLRSAVSLEIYSSTRGSPLTQTILSALGVDLAPRLARLASVVISYDDTEPWTSGYSDEGGFNPPDPALRYPAHKLEAPYSQFCAHLEMLSVRERNPFLRNLEEFKAVQRPFDRQIFQDLTSAPRFIEMVKQGWPVVVVSH